MGPTIYIGLGTGKGEELRDCICSSPMEVSADQAEELSAPPSITVEEWRGSSHTKLSKTAIVTADSSDLSVHRLGSQWSEVRRKILEAFVPENELSTKQSPIELNIPKDYIILNMHMEVSADQAEGLSAPPSITVEEWRGSSHTKLSKTAIVTADSSDLYVQRLGSQWSEVRRKILEAFVPEGFPGSVTPDYFPFQIWDSLQGLSTYVRSMLSTQALLSAIGVGEKSATVIGATFQWFLRDFTGMLGGILFTFYQGSNLDSNAKRWRLVADFMNDLGMLMDLVSPLFPSALILIVCVGSLSRSVTGVASGATRAALTQHFSLENNAADISAKEGSQETVATMIGMALGMLLAHFTRRQPLAIWLSFLSLTVFHMFANYKAVRCLSLTTLNNERGSILLQHFMRTGQVLSPQQVSVMEHVFPAWTSLWRSRTSKLLHWRVHLGVRVSLLKHPDMMELLVSTGSHYKRVKYLLLEREGEVHVVIHKQSTPQDVLQSFIHALVMVNLVGNSKSLHTESRLWMDEGFPVFLEKLQSSGWTTERLLSSSIVWKAHWVSDSVDEKLN